MRGNLRFRLLSAEPGEEIEYYLGQLAVARDEHDAAEAIAADAWAAYEEGLVTLVQRRLGRDFSYIAVAK